MTSDRYGDELLAQHAFVQRLARALLRDPELAADVAQDTLVAALEQQPPFAAPQQLRGWLRTVARRIAAATLGEQRERRLREARTARPEGADGERHAAEQLSLHRDLTAAVQALPEPYRTAVTLRYLADLPPRAIARQCGATAEVVRQRLHRGLSMLRTRLDREHGSRAAWAAPLAAALPTLSIFPLAVPLMAKKTFVAIAVLAIASTGSWFALQQIEAAPPPASTRLVAAPGENAAEPVPGATNPPAAKAAAASLDEPVRTSAEFVVALVDARDRVVADAEVHCLPTGGELLHRATDRDGHAVFPAGDGGGLLVVAVPGRPPLLTEATVLRGEQRLVLADGRAVAGAVLVDGEPAPPGLRLELATTRADAAPLPPAIAELLASRATSSTDRNGRFAFRGLASDWHGHVQLPPTHWLLPQPGREPDGERRLPLAAPDEQLVVWTTRLPSLRGRVVWADDGSAVPGASLFGHATFADATRSVATSIEADRDGRFELALWPAATMVRERWRDPRQRPPVASATLLVSAPGSGGGHSFAFAAADLTATDGLVVRLPRAGVQTFAAVDEHGDPVPGARVLADELSAPAGSDGRGTFCGGPRFVGAPGHAILAVAADARPEGDAIVFVLPHGAALQLRLHADDGGPAEFAHAVLDAPSPLFDGAPLGTSLHRAFSVGIDGGSYEHDDGPVQLNLRPGPDGMVSLASPRPGLDCTLRISDALHLPLVEQVVRTPPAGASAMLDVAVPTARRRVHGQVANAFGEPIDGAAVHLRRAGALRDEAGTITQADGSFALPPTIHNGPLLLRIERRGFATAERELPAGADCADFRLATGRRVEVQIAAADGTAVPIETVFVRANGQARLRVPMQALAAGRMAFVDLPARGLDVVCRLGGREFAAPIADDADAATLTIEVTQVAFAPAPAGFPLPAVGSLGIRGQCLEPPGEPFALRLPGAEDAPAVLPTGRYRFVLVRNDWQADRHRTEVTELPATAEVLLRGGERATVTLQ